MVFLFFLQVKKSLQCLSQIRIFPVAYSVVPVFRSFWNLILEFVNCSIFNSKFRYFIHRNFLTLLSLNFAITLLTASLMETLPSSGRVWYGMVERFKITFHVSSSSLEPWHSTAVLDIVFWYLLRISRMRFGKPRPRRLIFRGGKFSWRSASSRNLYPTKLPAIRYGILHRSSL